ncbi:MAG: UDP-3-O-(3-hydroxymyristoyl)glucosamine N-acyltransferase [Gemmatimonadales bacterium]
MLLSALKAVPERTLIRDGQFLSLAFIDHPAQPMMLVALYQGRYLGQVQQSSGISCVITTERLAPHIPEHFGLLLAADPKNALYDVHEYLVRHTDFYGRPASSRIAESATVHPGAYLAPHDVEIATGTVIEPHATILERTRIGAGAVIRAGSVIGAEGFSARLVGGRQVSVPHAGWVQIGEEVQVLSNCTIVRATFGGATTIGEQTVINAQSYIAHNVRIGKRCRIAAGAVIAGSAHLGDEVWIGPNAVISNSVRIGDRAWVGLGAVVVRDVAPGERVSGYYAIPHRTFLANLARGRSEPND